MTELVDGPGAEAGWAAMQASGSLTPGTQPRCGPSPWLLTEHFTGDPQELVLSLKR